MTDEEPREGVPQVRARIEMKMGGALAKPQEQEPEGAGDE